jgi:tRNA/tmRNA/rRNA uracil-C5-methylase (TrmA/RlmC/RlmD family)
VVLEAVFGSIRPSVAICVSCKPRALTRDLRIATAHGYGIEWVQPVDMLPHTAHVETVVKLPAR